MDNLGLFTEQDGWSDPVETSLDETLPTTISDAVCENAMRIMTMAISY